jgi:hypothetical protein
VNENYFFSLTKTLFSNLEFLKSNLYKPKTNLMKTKLLSIFALFAFAFAAHSQCAVTMTSLSVSGMTATGSAVGTGAITPIYVWLWGDSQTSSSQNASHTYATAGTYTVCVVYADVSNSSCNDSTCQVIVVPSASGIAVNQPVKADVKVTPNPFAASTTIDLTLNQSTDVVISVYDITGKEVATLQNGPMDAGFYLITWKPEALADGIYFMQIRTGATVQTRKIVHTTTN